MQSDTKLMAYGENAATFLLFRALAATHGAVNQVLLANLKGFGTGKKHEWPTFDELGVWLFPNFGKGAGFGEPDVVVLARDSTNKEQYAFWIEVETTMDCKAKLPSLKRSLLQLRRFHLFQQAVNAGVRNDHGARRIIGKTIGDSGAARDAQLRVAGHGVLQEVLGRLRAVGTKENDHCVLFTVNKPAGEGKGGRGYAKVLFEEAARLGTPAEISSTMPLGRCWYAYWKGDLEPRFNKGNPTPFDIDESYVRIRR